MGRKWTISGPRLSQLPRASRTTPGLVDEAAAAGLAARPAPLVLGFADGMVVEVAVLEVVEAAVAVTLALVCNFGSEI